MGCGRSAAARTRGVCVRRARSVCRARPVCPAHGRRRQINACAALREIRTQSGAGCSGGPRRGDPHLRHGGETGTSATAEVSTARMSGPESLLRRFSRIGECPTKNGVLALHIYNSSPVGSSLRFQRSQSCRLLSANQNEGKEAMVWWRTLLPLAGSAVCRCRLQREPTAAVSGPSVPSATAGRPLLPLANTPRTINRGPLADKAAVLSLPCSVLNRGGRLAVCPAGCLTPPGGRWSVLSPGAVTPLVAPRPCTC